MDGRQSAGHTNTLTQFGTNAVHVPPQQPALDVNSSSTDATEQSVATEQAEGAPPTVVTCAPEPDIGDSGNFPLSASADFLGYQYGSGFGGNLPSPRK